MGDQKGLLAAVVTLVCIYVPARGEKGCNGFRHLDNGQTFFRYGGLLVVFRCHSGYKLHGFTTSSCVSGHWSREPPVCVGSGCSSPGSLIHGTSTINEDGSWIEFSCNRGFHLHGHSMLYCKGHGWNGTKPVCKESDMMSSILGVSVNKSYIHQSFQAISAPKSQKFSHSDTSSLKADLKFNTTSLMPVNNVTGERINGTNSTTHLQTHTHFTSTKVSDVVRTSQGSGRPSSQVKASSEETGMWDTTLTTKYHLSASVSPSMLLISGTESLASSPSSFSAAHTSTVTAFTNPVLKQSSQHHTNFTLPSFGFQKLVTSQDMLTPAEEKMADNKEKQAETGVQSAFLPHPLLLDHLKPTERSNLLTPTSTSSPIPTNFNVTTHGITLPPNMPTTNALKSLWAKYQNLSEHLSFSGRPVCPYPPVPAHGTFYIDNIENPGPSKFRHHIRYACYPGYKLSHGDMQSYCQQRGTWSGITPVCLDFDECKEGQHRCQQSCINTFGSYKCSCDVGFQPTPDQTFCTDVDECLLPAAVTGCMFGCVNTLGSFHCQCPAGYSQHAPDGLCQDIDECAVNKGLGPCMQQCQNSPGSYRCSCTYGHILAGNGHNCFSECPPGYRKQTGIPPDMSTNQTLKDECVDINECLEDMCEWQCINLPGSHRCICPRGYTLQNDGHHCKDINECKRKNGGCSHLCVNRRGGYKCACPSSHRLSSYSWKKCLPRTTEETFG